MPKKVFPVKIDPDTIKKLKAKGKRMVKARSFKSINEMCERVLTEFANK